MTCSLRKIEAAATRVFSHFTQISRSVRKVKERLARSGTGSRCLMGLRGFIFGMIPFHPDIGVLLVASVGCFRNGR